MQLTAQLTDAQHTLTNYNHSLKHHFSNYEGKIEKIANDIAANTIAEVTKSIDQSMATLQGKFLQTSETFESNLNHIADNIIQDVYAASDEAYQTLQEKGEDIMNKFTTQLQQEGDRLHKHTTKAQSPPSTVDIIPFSKCQNGVNIQTITKPF